jgi:hypothetical protein
MKKDMDRRTFIKGLGAAVTLAPGVSLLGGKVHAAENTSRHLHRIYPRYMVSKEVAQDWHVRKDSMGGPTIAGSPSWKNFLNLCEEELQTYGVVDMIKHPWTYTRWESTEWPDDSKWGLTVDGEKIQVASTGCNSGSTSKEGVTGQLVRYEEGMDPEKLRGKIAVILKDTTDSPMTVANLDLKDTSGGVVRVGDYEYLSSEDTFPNPQVPRWEGGQLSPFRLMGTQTELETLVRGGAIGALLILRLSHDALSGTYTFPVPALHNMPTLYIDKKTGRNLIKAAEEGKEATLRLEATTHESETYQLFGYLPGKDYGTEKDEQILLITHTDGPSISQDNGALGILGLVRYFSNIPQAERPRTLQIFLDCRHYMPGMERAFTEESYPTLHPEIHNKVVAAMGMEHLGQMQVKELDGYGLTDKVELSTVWVTEDQYLVDLTIQAVKDNELARVQVQCPGRLGKHGGEQGPWYGLGRVADRLEVPGASTMGSMTAYWSSKARMDYFDAEHFVDQVATMSQICGNIMTANISK